ncbi:MAG: zinc-ribbon domain-containing protein [Desulfovibrionaceae bacterium]|nr:zinc-ribbon domain-containing protein [Desulfovibrionaceae bacterium]
MIRCTKCGTQNNDDDRFCCKCGQKLQSERRPPSSKQAGEVRFLEKLSIVNLLAGRAMLKKCLETWIYCLAVLFAALYSVFLRSWLPLVLGVAVVGLVAWLRKI